MPDYNQTHEINSRRMINLCLSMRGFYLKTGQFLGTRHDFMPINYIKKLSQLHDNVPPLSGIEIRAILERELGGTVESFFSSLDLDYPIGAASIAQVHQGVWRETGQAVAVKVQYPNAERLMKGDLRNLRRLAEFLQRTELKFDLLSAIKELQKQIKNEFDFVREAQNMDSIGAKLASSVPAVRLPKSIRATRHTLIMTFVDGPNLSKMDEFRASPSRFIPGILKQRAGKKLLDVLAQAWGAMLFDLRAFQADPHPGNICISPTHGIGLLDWGQVKHVSDSLALKFGTLVLAIHANKESEIVDALFDLGVTVSNPSDRKTVSAIAVTMLDTRRVKGYVIDPFSPDNSLKTNSVTKVGVAGAGSASLLFLSPSSTLVPSPLLPSPPPPHSHSPPHNTPKPSQMPSDLYFVVRTVQLLRGIAHAFDLDYSLADRWAPYARRAVLLETEKVKARAASSGTAAVERQ